MSSSKSTEPVVNLTESQNEQLKPIPVGRRFRDISGMRFCRWTVLGFVGQHQPYGSRWLCRCECGTIRVVLGDNLRAGGSKSCGCLTQPSIEKRIWPRVNKIPDGCWEWTGATTGFGYGKITIKRESHDVHRLVYQLTRGEIPDGLLVLHRCDNPKCCKPEHLYVGTPKDNMLDRSRRRRFAFKLNPEKAKEIFIMRVRDRRTIASIARAFDVSSQTVKSIVARKIWVCATESVMEAARL